MISGRRKFIFMLSTLAVPVSVTFGHFLTRGKPSDDIAGHFSGLLTETKSSKFIGIEYLRIHPDEANMEVLFETIFTESNLQDQFLASDIQGKRGIIEGMIRQDFRHGRTVSLDGWVLSQTEVRLYAVASLVS